MSSESYKPIIIPEDKENVKKLFEKNEPLFVKTRNPLSEINEKIIPQNVIKQTYHKKIKKVVIKRSTLRSEVEVKQFSYFSENIGADDDDVDDDVFLEDQFVKNLPEIKKDKSEKSVLPEVKITQATTEKKVAQKVTLARKLSNKQKKFNLEECFKDSLYDEDYFLDNYKYILERERKFVYRRDILKEYADESYRMLVVNWLHYVHQILDLNEHTFLAAIRMFDCILITTRLLTKRYVLVGVVCLWIANKHHDVHFIKIPKLVAICNGNYSKLHIMQAEKDTLRILGFTVNFPEPASILFYYLKKEKLENDKKIRGGAMFVLELFTLLLEFSSLTPSLLASMALMLAMIKYKSNNTSFLEYIHCHLLDRDIFLRKTKQMGVYIQKLLSCKRSCNEILDKYLKGENAFVVQDFMSE